MISDKLLTDLSRTEKSFINSKKAMQPISSVFIFAAHVPPAKKYCCCFNCIAAAENDGNTVSMHAVPA